MNRLFLTLIVLAAANAVTWYFALAPRETGLVVTFLDVGQGDAILIEAGGVELLIDGGPDRSVLRRLPRELGLLDREIDALLATHPDRDHIAGLSNVLARYQVSYFLDSGMRGNSPYAKNLEVAIAREPAITRVTLRRNMRIHIGDGAYADVLFPDRDVSGVESNTGSVTVRLVYGTTSFLLAGDLPKNVEDYLAELDGLSLHSTVLKASHHGSKTSTSQFWLSTIQSKVVVISAGRENSYGHPAPEVLDRIRATGATILSTAEEGTLRFVSDGRTVKKR